MRALAVNSAQRSPALPDVPTVAEEAIPGFEAAGWQGWFVPASTPRDVVAYLQRETAKVIADPDMQARLKAMGNEPVGSTTEAFDGTLQIGSGEVCKSREGSEYPDAGLIQNFLGEYGMHPLTLICALAVVFGLSAPRASAQNFPSKPVRIIVPFAAGGAVDVLARLVGSKLQEAFRQPVIVENRPGAGGNLGADLVAKSAPDGTTILLTPNGQAISPSLYRNLPYDGRNDLTPVTQLVASNLVLVASPKSSVTSVRRLDRAGQGQSGQAELWLERRRQSAASDDGNVQARRRHRHRGDPLQERRRDQHQPDQWRHAGGGRAVGDGAATDRGRPAARARRHRRAPRHRDARHPDGCRKRRAGFRIGELAGLLRGREDAA